MEYCYATVSPLILIDQRKFYCFKDSFYQWIFYLAIILLASERSERDTYRGNTIENRGCLFIYLYM